MSSESNEAGGYATHSHLVRRWRNLGRKLAFSGSGHQAWSAWRRKLRAKLLELTGQDTMVTAPLAPRVTEEHDFPGYRRQRVEITTEPGVVMPIFVLIPRDGRKAWPAVLAPHGHGGGGKSAVAGCHDNPQVAAAIDEYNYDYGVQFARAGFVAFCPDARGFGERQEAPVQHDILAGSCQYLNNAAIALGQTILGMWVRDLQRLVDYVETRPDCLSGQVGCAGLSGGGMQTLWLSALDERVRCAVVSGYFYGCRESLLDMYNCACNYVPHLWEYVDMGDIGALVAPRPLLIETGDKDALNGASGLANVRSQVAVARRAYRLLGAGAALRHTIHHGGHKWFGGESIAWMRSHLDGKVRPAESHRPERRRR
jgi:dienelactone hydrolase